MQHMQNARLLCNDSFQYLNESNLIYYAILAWVDFWGSVGAVLARWFATLFKCEDRFRINRQKFNSNRKELMLDDNQILGRRTIWNP